MRTILISGANRGIGLNIAHKELKEGNRISVGIRDLAVSYTHLTLPTIFRV